MRRWVQAEEELMAHKQKDLARELEVQSSFPIKTLCQNNPKSFSLHLLDIDGAIRAKCRLPQTSVFF